MRRNCRLDRHHTFDGRLRSLQYVLEKAAERWFSALIVRLTLLSIVTLGTMLWWELIATIIVVSFRNKNRQLAGSIFLFIKAGIRTVAASSSSAVHQNLLSFGDPTGLAPCPAVFATAVAVVRGRL